MKHKYTLQTQLFLVKTVEQAKSLQQSIEFNPFSSTDCGDQSNPKEPKLTRRKPREGKTQKPRQLGNMLDMHAITIWMVVSIYQALSSPVSMPILTSILMSILIDLW